MSKFLSAAASEEFDTEVKHEYQKGQELDGTVTLRTTGANPYNFRRMGKGLANQKASSEDVTPMNVDHVKVPVTLQNWNAPEYTDIFDDAQVNFSERNELAETIGMALGRRKDQLCIDAMLAATGIAGTVGTDVGGVGTDWNVAKARRAKRYLDDQGVPATGRHIALSAEGLEAMLGQTEATSADYNTVRALVNGEINSFVGFQWHVIETRVEGGLPKSGAVRTSFAWHDRGVGTAEATLERMSSVDWIAQKTSWLSNGMIKCGSVDRDPLGIVHVQTTEA